ncbi:zinc finger CCCH domain-containing protein 10-like isoform X1 [Ostrinia furnacalis]|uniref:zinc finger CCCH domain-containing protein 10-like isoform X1 n=1 Tax=Ostrinia furnacalis TaxID=93504 RepID=UPI00103A2DB1|nr:zinc finger CCCH domain-containing protein 10-like isoform X1 [Ostrinia furnacalis]
MCKDWVRGTCARGAACIYAHELDKDQLKGVYRFCRDFENDRCERQVCYFVHATTFEKEHFFRTAFLPPHALHHLKTAVIGLCIVSFSIIVGLFLLSKTRQVFDRNHT